MSISITDVNYSYPIASTIGSKEVSTNQDISGNSIKAICQAYEKLFGIVKEDSNSTIKGIEGKANQLLVYVNEILGKNYSLDQLEDIATIFDEDAIISKSLNENNEYLECKEGLKAYKFYLKEVLTKLYNLHAVIEDAKDTIEDLEKLTADTEETLNNEAHRLITKLQIYDQQSQDLLKAFTEYSVVKNLTVTQNITYNDGSSDKTDQVDHRTYECVEKAYRSLDNLIDKTTGRSVGEYKHPSWLVSVLGNKWLSEKGTEWLKTDVAWTWLVDNYKTYSTEGKAWLQTEAGVNWLNTTTGEAFKTATNNATDQPNEDDILIHTLYGIQTEKQNVSRTYKTSYYKTNGYNATKTYADKYDLSAQIEQEIDSESSPTTLSGMALFDELTLLEKLQYIKIYYSDSKNQRYVYPEDNKIGYPCIKSPASTDALNDTKELGQVEMFYLGYVINRDGPINALASFLEIKTTAIKTQIKVLMERIKAIKAYSTLLRKGFEEFSSVAENYGAKNKPFGRPTIPRAAFYIYRYLSSSATRCFYYIDDTPYIMVQYSHANTGEFCEDNGKGPDSTAADDWNESPSKYYILVKADDNGIDAFVKFLNNLPTNKNFWTNDPTNPQTATIDPGDPQKDYYERILDLLFTETYASQPDNRNNNYSCKYNDDRYYHIFLKDVNTDETSFSYYIRMDDYIEKDKDVWGDNSTWQHKGDKGKWRCYWCKTQPRVYCDGTNVKFEKIEDKYDLPKKLDVPKAAGTNATQWNWNEYKMAWNNLSPDTGNDSANKSALSSFMGIWKGNFETQIANYKTCLDQQEKEITTLQKKIQTFDATTTNFRNKAFTVYNKIVNKIK